MRLPRRPAASGTKGPPGDLRYRDKLRRLLPDHDGGDNPQRDSPQRVADALLGRERLWWECCQEAVRKDPAWLLAKESEGARDWLADIASEHRRQAGQTAAYLNSVYLVARTCDAAAQPENRTEADRRRDQALVSSNWEESGLLMAGPAVSADQFRQAGELITITRLLLTGGWRLSHRSVRLPVVFGGDGPDGGAVGYLELRELRGGLPGLFPDPRTMGRVRAGDSEFGESLGYAWSASGPLTAGRCILWNLDVTGASGLPLTIAGGSLGAAFAIGLKRVLRYPTSGKPSPAGLIVGLRRLRPRTAITGALDADGRLSRVSHMDAKLNAAHAKGWLLVAPAENKDDRDQAAVAGMVRFANTLGEAERYVWRWRARLIATMVALVIFFAGGLTAEALTGEHIVNVLHATQVSENLGQYVVNQVNAGSFGSGQVVTNALLAVDAYQTAPTGQAADALFDSYALLSPFRVLLGNFTDEQDVLTVAESPDGAMVAIGNGSDIQLWEVAATGTGRRLLGTIPGTGIGYFSFSADGRYLVLAGASLELWRTTPLTMIKKAALPETGNQNSPIDANQTVPVVSPDDRYVEIDDATSTPVVWNLASGAIRQLDLPRSGALEVTTAGFADGDTVYAVTKDQVVSWNPATRQVVGIRRASVTQIVTGTSSVDVNCVDGVWRFTDLLTGKPEPALTARPPCSTHAEADALAGGFFVTQQPMDLSSTAPGYQADVGSVINLRTGQTVAQASLPEGDRAAGISTSGKQLLVQGYGPPGLVGIARLVPPGQLSALNGTSGGWYPGGPASPDGRLLVTAATGTVPEVYVEDRKTGILLHTLPLPHTGYPADSAVADHVDPMFLPDGNLLVLAAGELTLWNAATGTRLAPPVMLTSGSSHPSRVPPAPQIAVDPAAPGEIAMTGPDDDSVELLEVGGWRQLHVLAGFPGTVAAAGLMFSQDGTMLAVVSSSTDPTDTVFRTSAGSQLIETTLAQLGNADFAYPVALPGGYTGLVPVASTTSVLGIWRAGSLVAVLSAPADMGLEVSRSAQGPDLLMDVLTNDAAASPVGEPFDLPPSPAAWVSHLCALIGRPLSQQERLISGQLEPDNGCK